MNFFIPNTPLPSAFEGRNKSYGAWQHARHANADTLRAFGYVMILGGLLMAALLAMKEPFMPPSNQKEDPIENMFGSAPLYHKYDSIEKFMSMNYGCTSVNTISDQELYKILDIQNDWYRQKFLLPKKLNPVKQTTGGTVVQQFKNKQPFRRGSFNSSAAYFQDANLIRNPNLQWNENLPVECMDYWNFLPRPLNLRQVASEIGYPKIAQEIGLEGKVIYRLLVHPNGNIIAAMLVKTPHPILSNEIEKHLFKIQFERETENPRKCTVWVTRPFSFKLTP